MRSQIYYKSSSGDHEYQDNILLQSIHNVFKFFNKVVN